MIDRTFGGGFVVGLFVGLLVGLIIGIQWCLSLVGYYTVPPVVENDGSDVLTQNGVYMGSLSLAGLVMFGSTILIRAFGVNKFDTWKQNAGSFMVIGSTLFLAIFHAHYAFWYPNSFSTLWMYVGSVASFLVFMIGAAMVSMGGKKQLSASDG